MGIFWNIENCENWHLVLVSALELAKAMTGFKPSGFVTISNENYEDIAQYIYKRMPFRKRGQKARLGNSCRCLFCTNTLGWHKAQCRNAIGFRREYHR